MPTNLKNKIQKNLTVLNGKYRVISEIEDLEQGTRYYAESVDDAKLFYLEVFYDKAISSPEEFSALEDEFFEFLEKRPEICLRPLEVFLAKVDDIDHQFPVCVYEKPDGPTLRTMMKLDEDGCVESGRAFEIMKILAGGLAALAELGIYHGNLNPDTVVVSPQNEVTLLFIPFLKELHGVSFDHDSSQRFYGAPELFLGESEIDLKTEIYAFGCLLHEVLEGGPPFLEDDQEDAHLHEDCPGLDGIPGKTHKLILRCLHKDRPKRPGDFQEIEKILSKFAGASGSSGALRKLLNYSVILLLLGGGYYGYDIYQQNEIRKKRQIAQQKQRAEEEARKLREEQEKIEREKAEAERKKIEEARKVRLAMKRQQEKKKKFKPPEIPGMVFFKESSFSMGDVRCYEDCNHVHLVELSSFYLDETEVTNEAYKEFVDKAGGPPPYNTRAKYNLWDGTKVPDEILKQPVINVSWEMAKAYCEFKEKRLPTEAEWEFGARGTYGRLYPWGSEDPTPVLAQFDGYWSGEKTLYEVRFFEPGKTPDGIYNLLGGVKEWVFDWYEPTYYENSAKKDPTGPENGSKKVVRGGSWEEIPEISAYRDALPPKSSLEGVGFRCAKTLVRPQ